MDLIARFAKFLFGFLFALLLGAGSGMCFAQIPSSVDRIATARQNGEIAVHEGEHIFALGRALLGDDLARLTRFRQDVLNPNLKLGMSGEHVVAGMRLQLPDYLKASTAPLLPVDAATALPLLLRTSDAMLTLAAQSLPELRIDTSEDVMWPLSLIASAAMMEREPKSHDKSVTASPSKINLVQIIPATMPAAPHVTLETRPIAAATPSASDSPPSMPPNLAPLPLVPAGEPATSELRVLTFEVVINGEKGGSWLFVERGAELFAPVDAFEEWRVRLPPDAPALQYRGQGYRALSGFRDFRSKIDSANQSLEFFFSPQSFGVTRLAQEPTQRPSVNPVLPSAFFNYDISYSSTEVRNLPATRSLGMLTEMGASNDWGLLTSTGVGQNLTGNSSLGQRREWLRLETTFTKDFPETNSTFRLGDTRTRGGTLGRDVFFGGIQYGTNFALSPGFISQPLPTLAGLSAAQSTVQLFVNDVLRQTSNVPSGPFTIDKLPGLNGSGEARMVVRDVLGRETVISQPFFTSTQLLTAGLTDWRTEAGSLRRDIGIRNNRYGPNFANGLWRHGINDGWTIETSAAATPKANIAGVASAFALPLQFLGKAGISVSDGRGAGSGTQTLLGLERLGYRNSVSIQSINANANYRQLGQDIDVRSARKQLAGNLSFSTATFGSFGLGFASISQFDDTRVTTISVNYSIRIGDRSNLTFSATQALATASGTSVALTVTIPLEKKIISTSSVSRTGGRGDVYVSAAQSPDASGGLGWRALAGHQPGVDRAEGGLYYGGRYGKATADISTSKEQTTTRLGGVGGVVVADGNFFVTPRVDQSFAVIEVPGYSNVGVGLGNTTLARTDAKGIALVPFLAPFQKNQILLDAQDLPVSAELDSIEHIVVPAYRSAVKAVFPVRSGRGALLRIVYDDGDPVPAGAIVRIEGDKQEFYVARRGEAFVTGLQATNRVSLIWKDRECVFEVVLPPESIDEISRIGPLKCTGMVR